MEKRKHLKLKQLKKLSKEIKRNEDKKLEEHIEKLEKEAVKLKPQRMNSDDQTSISTQSGSPQSK